MADSKIPKISHTKPSQSKYFVRKLPCIEKSNQKCKDSADKEKGKKSTMVQQNNEDEEVDNPPSPVLVRKMGRVKNSSFRCFNKGTSENDVLQQKATARELYSPPCQRKLNSKVIPYMGHKTPKGQSKENSVSPFTKRLKNNAGKSSCVQTKAKEQLFSPTLSRKLVIPESPSSVFMNEDDSFLDKVDFDELESLSTMSTPKSSLSQGDEKISKFSGNSSTSSYNLRSTPQRNVYRKLLNNNNNLKSKCSINKISDKISTLNSLDPKHGISINCIDISMNSPDLFEDAALEADIFGDGIGDIFEKSFEPELEPTVNHVKRDFTPQYPKSSIIQTCKSSNNGNSVSISPVKNHATNEASPDSVGANDSQMSFASTIESQPLIGRLQGRLKGLQPSQPLDVVQTEKERRAIAVSAALEEATRIHQSGSEFELGPFFGLPSMIADLLKHHRSISQLYDWQKECIAKGSGTNNLIFSLPTSGGKTLVAEILMMRQLLLKHKDTLLILPYVALVQEKVHGLSPFGVEMGFLIEEYAGSRGNFPPKSGRKKHVLYVATIEKASGLINSLLENNRMEELGLVVVDEVHMLGEAGRGATLETALTKLRYAAPKVQLVAMSATIGNLQELAIFLNAELYTGNFRPIALKEYVKIGEHIWELNPSAHTEEELLYKQRLCCFPYTEEQKHIDTDMVGGLVGEVVPNHSCIVFCPTRRNCETLSELICRILPIEITKYQRAEKVALYRALIEEGGGVVCPTLRKTLPYGIAYHHSGLTEGERRLIEEGYLVGTLCCLCCTSTLAAGVNLPARRVIIRSPYTGSEFLTRARYKQMVGRAGRAGLDTCGESFLILQSRDIKQTGKLLMSPMEVCHSTLALKDDFGLISLVFTSMGLGIAVTLPTLRDLASKSLLSLQSSNNHIDVEEKILQIIESLCRKGMVYIKNISKEEGNLQSASSTSLSSSSRETEVSEGSKLTQESSKSSETPTDPTKKDSIRLVNDTDVLCVSRLGRAAIKGNVDLDLAGQLYKDLCVARENLAVNSYLHLLYLVVPYDIASSIKVLPDVLYKAFLTLGEEEVKVAKLLHITEAVLIKLSMGQNSKKVKENVLQRFYVALMLHQLWSGTGIWQVSEMFHTHRGFVQQLLLSASSFASCIQHFCQELEELWAFRDLLSTFSRQLSGCCSVELLPLLDLPAVKKGRARMLYKAGYHTLHDIANADVKSLVASVEHLPYRTASQIINSAKMLLIEKAETLQGEADEVLSGLHYLPNDHHESEATELS